jgi:putative DNA primase/helicase
MPSHDFTAVRRTVYNHHAASERFLLELDHLGKRYRRGSANAGQLSKFHAQCPGHDDHRESLVVTQVEGMLLLWCHGECQGNEAVIAAVGWTKRDLYDNPRGADYRYSDGRVVHRRYQGNDKRFFQSGMKNSRSVLYRLENVKAAVTRGRGVYLVEGEADVHALESLGAIATTAPQGAANFHKVDPSPLYGAHVRAVVDQDSNGAGLGWAVQVFTALCGKAASLQFMQARVGKDAADHIAAGHGLADFEPIYVWRDA